MFYIEVKADIQSYLLCNTELFVSIMEKNKYQQQLGYNLIFFNSSFILVYNEFISNTKW